MPETTVSIVGKMTQLIEPILEDMGFELVDIEYLPVRGRWVLRIYVDKEGGITLDDCASVSHEVGDFIDVKDIFQHEYVLEISSPGLNRPLKREKDLIRAVGKRIEVKMSTNLDGRRNFAGYLQDFKDGMLHLKVEENLVLLCWRDVEKANLLYEFED
ncbi:MAG: ribosome maturation factor RimP [Thermodesulfobacteriota bacterium]|nr:ribosome maturation factor RimP [Thermodesulfobacteriota bacterium]